MIQNLIVKVNAPKPLKEYGDGFLLLYDAVKECFFVTTRESLFSIQDAKIKKLEAKMEKFMKEQTEKTQIFIDDSNEQFKEFLEKYTATNEKLIDMVEAVIKEGE